MRSFKLVIMIVAVLVLLVGAAGYYKVAKAASADKGKQDKKAEVQVSKDAIENQKKILKELKIIRQNQTKMMEDLKFIRVTQRPR